MICLFPSWRHLFTVLICAEHVEHVTYVPGVYKKTHVSRSMWWGELSQAWLYPGITSLKWGSISISSVIIWTVVVHEHVQKTFFPSVRHCKPKQINLRAIWTHSEARGPPSKSYLNAGLLIWSNQRLAVMGAKLYCKQTEEKTWIWKVRNNNSSM